MFRMRSVVASVTRSRGILAKIPTPMRQQKHGSHDEGPPQPFDNMPFRITNRYLTSVFFAFFFGAGLWAPFIIVWYAMAKRTL